MMHSFFLVLFWLPLASGIVVLEGCSLSRQSPSTRLYVLTALPQSERALQRVPTSDGAIGVGPVTLPQYTNRPQIVTGNSSAELGRAAFDQWAEPLDGNFARILAENLSLLLATEQVVVFPWLGPMPIAYQVIVEVTQFLGELGGQVSLDARWSVVSKNGKEVLVTKRASFTASVGGQDYQALVAALSRTVAALSRDIAATIATLASTPAQD
jgi:uncharacterized lipoprotein YmbA